MITNKIDVLISQKKYKKALGLLKKVSSLKGLSKYQVAIKTAFCLRESKQNGLALLEWKNAVCVASNKKEKLDSLKMLGQESLIIGRKLEAYNTFKEILKIDSSVNSSEIKMAYCQLGYELGKTEEIKVYAETLLNTEVYFQESMYLLCEIALKSLDKPQSLVLLRRFSQEQLKLEPKFVSYIAQSYIKLNESDLCESLLINFSKTYNSEPWFRVLMAMLALYNKQYQKVKELLEGLSEVDMPKWMEAKEFYLSLLAQANEKLGCNELSFKQYSLLAEKSEKKHSKYPRKDYVKLYRKVDLDALPIELENEIDFEVVFMLGFPRSGTTLLETILDTNPKIVSMSEPKTISKVISKLNELSKRSYPENLMDINEDILSTLRKVYLDEVHKTYDIKNSIRCVVDKMPLNTIHLPLIRTLFPNAKVLLNIRHPLDVIYSNFQQSYSMNNEMSFLITLSGIAKRYRQVFNFYSEIKEQLNLETLAVRYEDLVSDLETEYKRVVDFLSVDFDEGYKNYSELAKDKVINTSSKNQVSKPLYKSSMYKWEKVKNEMTSIIPIVDDYIVKFGYQK